MSAENTGLKNLADIQNYVTESFGDDEVPEFITKCFAMLLSLFGEEMITRNLDAMKDQKPADTVGTFLTQVLFKYTLFGTFSKGDTHDFNVLLEKGLISQEQLDQIKSDSQENYYSS